MAQVVPMSPPPAVAHVTGGEQVTQGTPTSPVTIPEDGDFSLGAGRQGLQALDQPEQ